MRSTRQRLPRSEGDVAEPKRERSLGGQSTIVFGGLALSIALGIVLQSYLASKLGTSKLADVFFLGTTVPTLIATATLGSASSALIRYATDTPETLDPRRPGTAGRTLLKLSLVVSAGIIVVGALFRFDVIRYSDNAETDQLGTFLLLTAPIPPLVACSAVGGVLALAHKRFFRAAWGGAVNGAALLTAAVIFGRGGLSAENLAIAVVLGYVAQLMFVVPAYRWAGDPGRVIDLRQARAATTGVLLLLGASAIYKSQPLIERAVGTVVGSGVPAALGYQDKITAGLTQLAVFGFAFAAMPSISRDFAASDLDRATKRLVATIVATFTASAVVLAFAITSAGEIVRVLYERGSFSSASTELTQTLVLFSLPSVFFGAMAGPLVSVAYANKRVREVVRIGIAGFVVGTSMTIVLGLTVGPEGIVAGTAVGFAVTFVLFATRVKVSLPLWSWPALVRDQGRDVAVVAAAVSVAALMCSFIPLSREDSTILSLLILGARLVVIASAGFGALLGVRKLPHLWRTRLSR